MRWEYKFFYSRWMGVVNGLYFINQKPKAKSRKCKVTIFVKWLCYTIVLDISYKYHIKTIFTYLLTINIWNNVIQNFVQFTHVTKVWKYIFFWCFGSIETINEFDWFLFPTLYLFWRGCLHMRYNFNLIHYLLNKNI